MVAASAVWRGGSESRLEDGRGHVVTVDLPADEGGGDRGTSALELAVLSLAGCITTIFALVARRRRLAVDAVRIELEADRPRGAATIARIRGTAQVSTAASREAVETALGITLRTCPVGVLFHRAGIPVEVELILVRPETEGARTATTVLAGA